MKIALLFSGQGAQYASMGSDLYAQHESVRHYFEQADEVLGYNLKDIVFSEDVLLHSTLYAQPAIFTLSSAIANLLKEADVSVEGVAGLSLGEYTAMHEAGMFDFKTGITLLNARAEAMQTAAKNTPSSMVAILSDEASIIPIVDQINDCFIANYNLEKQHVVGGSKEAVARFIKLAKEAGIKRVIPLETSGAFHTPLMNEATKLFAPTLEVVTFNKPKLPIYFNLTQSNEYDGTMVSYCLNQMVNPVKFHGMIKAMIDDGFDTFIECGPKNTLASFVKKIDRNVKVLNVENSATLKDTLEALKELS